MPSRNAPHLDALIASVTKKSATVEQPIRQAIIEGKPLSAAIDVFVRKVLYNPSSMSDGDFEAMKAQGFSEDQIFEIVVCASIAAGVERVDRGLAAAGLAR